MTKFGFGVVLPLDRLYTWRDALKPMCSNKHPVQHKDKFCSECGRPIKAQNQKGERTGCVLNFKNWDDDWIGNWEHPIFGAMAYPGDSSHSKHLEEFVALYIKPVLNSEESGWLVSAAVDQETVEKARAILQTFLEPLGLWVPETFGFHLEIESE